LASSLETRKQVLKNKTKNKKRSRVHAAGQVLNESAPACNSRVLNCFLLLLLLLLHFHNQNHPSFSPEKKKHSKQGA